MSSYVSRALRLGACPADRSGDVALAEPIISVPAAIADYDGLLPITVLGDDLEINMPWWDGVRPQMRLQAAWKLFIPGDPNDPGVDDLVGTEYIVTEAEADASTTVFKIYVPSDRLVHGVYIVRVRALSFPGGNESFSQRLTVRVDTVAPGGGAFPLLLFPPAVAQSGMIVDSDIINGQLKVQLAHYEGIARGDKIDLYIGTTLVNSQELDQEPTNPDEFIQLYYPEDALEQVRNGVHLFSFGVTDKSGNFASSFTVQYDIQLHTIPTIIPAPTVPQADSDLLDEAEARSGTLVNITKYDLAQVGDEIQVNWGSQLSDKHALTATDLPNDPILVIDLSYALVAAETEVGNVDVWFEVFRNGKSIGKSLTDNVEVDLRLPGGPDPDPETPEHENLLPLVVRSFSNTGSPPPGPEDNIIPPEDFDQNATAYIPWLGKDGDDVYELEDLIKLTWGSQTQTTVTRSIVQKDLDDGVDLQLTVPGTTIEAEGSGSAIPVGYTVTRITDGTPSATNTATAAPTPVDVTGPDELPGEGTIDDVVFTVLNELGAIGYAQLIGPSGSRYNPVQTRLDYSNVVAGSKVTLFFTGYDQLTGGNLIPAATYSATYNVTEKDIVDGRLTYDFNVPATYHFAVCSQGHVEAYVVFENDKGSAQSDPKSAYCDVKLPGESVCPGGSKTCRNYR
uniref:Uncharacterized protein n=1 Tax=Pseudomonas graminis TaxID=158627 RepID=A0A7C2B0G2_9PSED